MTDTTEIANTPGLFSMTAGVGKGWNMGGKGVGKDESSRTVKQPQEATAKRADFRDMPKCQARAKSSGQKCKNVAMKGKRVCRIHGGKSKGPRTEEGKKRARFGNLKSGDYTAQRKQNLSDLAAVRRYFELEGII